MSTEPTPDLRRNCHPSCIRKPELSCATCRDWLATADLIESQQARIEELERIVRTYAVMTRTQGLGLSESDAALLASLAASPDTPETRP